MLDEFSPAKADVETSIPSQSKSSASKDADVLSMPEGVTDADFAAQLQAGMADLLGELETSVRLHNSRTDTTLIMPSQT